MPLDAKANGARSKNGACPVDINPVPWTCPVDGPRDMKISIKSMVMSTGHLRVYLLSFLERIERKKPRKKKILAISKLPPKGSGVPTQIAKRKDAPKRLCTRRSSKHRSM